MAIINVDSVCLSGEFAKILYQFVNSNTLFASKAYKKNPPTIEAVIKAISCSIKIRQLTHKLDFIFAAQSVFVLA